MELLDLKNLSRGTERQKLAFQALQRLGIFELLKEHCPVVAGAIPIDIDLPESPLEIICSTDNLETFSEDVNQHFRDCEKFELHHTVFRNQPTVTAKFTAYGFQVELFAQGQSVFTQPTVLYTLLEARILTFAPKEAKDKIRELKKQGLTTEQAFAQCFEITGDANEELLKLAKLPDKEILIIAHRMRFTVH
jgi:hypothetical protein